MSIDQLIMDKVHSAVRLSEGELRYQLAKHDHPLADSDELLWVLARLEREGRVRCELYVTEVVA